jgi:hypothetical protein
MYQKSVLELKYLIFSLITSKLIPLSRAPINLYSVLMMNKIDKHISNYISKIRR